MTGCEICGGDNFDDNICLDCYLNDGKPINWEFFGTNKTYYVNNVIKMAKGDYFYSFSYCEDGKISFYFFADNYYDKEVLKNIKLLFNE